MAFVRPTLTELVDRIQQDLVTRLEIGSAVLRRAIVRVHAIAMAGAAHMLHGHLEHLSKQPFPDLSDDDYLIRQAALFGLSIKAAAFAKGNVVIWGTHATVIPVSTVLLRSDGAEFKTDAEVTIATLTAWAPSTAYAVGNLRTNGGNIYQCAVAGTSAGSGGPTGTGTAIVDNGVTWRFVAAGSAAVSAAVKAVLAGAAGNTSAGVALTLGSPIAGANSTTMVAVTALTSGTDEETVEELRTRLLERLRNPPHGGNAADYVAWAKEVAGVTRAWCYPRELGIGAVTVRFVRDNDASLIPDAAEVTAVQQYIDGKRPVTADVTVLAPVAVPLNFNIHIEPDTSATRAAVEAELKDLIARSAVPGGTTLLSQIEVAVGVAEGITNFTIWSPTTDTVRTTGQLTTMGVITWS